MLERVWTKGYTSYTIGGNITSFSHDGKQYGNF